ICGLPPARSIGFAPACLPATFFADFFEVLRAIALTPADGPIHSRCSALGKRSPAPREAGLSLQLDNAGIIFARRLTPPGVPMLARLLGALLVSLAISDAAADDGALCKGEGNPAPAERLAACTRIVDSGATGAALAEAHLNRGRVYQAAGDAARALAEYDRVIALDPANFFAHNNRGVLHLDAKRFEAALADLTRAIELAPYDSRGWLNRAAVYLDLK